MRRLALFVVVGLLVLSAVSASAASLAITSDPVMQVFRFDIDPPAPPVEDVDLHVEVRAYAGSSEMVKNTFLLGPYPVRPDQGYLVGYDGQLLPCPEGSTTGPSQVGGPFDVLSGGVHVLCVQHGESADNVVTLRSGDSERRIVLPKGAVPGAASEPVRR